MDRLLAIGSRGVLEDQCATNGIDADGLAFLATPVGELERHHAAGRHLAIGPVRHIEPPATERLDPGLEP
jgi:hypothetical protein